MESSSETSCTILKDEKDKTFFSQKNGSKLCFDIKQTS
jgi:hypothetical protein